MKVYGELEKAILERLASDPATGVEGQVYFNTTDKAARVYRNGAWTPVGAASSAVAQDVASSGSAGTSVDSARADHVHRGVSSLARAGDSKIYGDTTLAAGTGVALTQAGNQITITATAGSGVPVGSIVAFSGGYFTAAANGGTYADVVGNTIAAVNSYVAASGFAVCDGTQPNDPASPIFNTPGRFLPDLTGSRFLQGSTVAGSSGGQNSVTLSLPNLPPHTHGIDHTHPAHSHSISHDHGTITSSEWGGLDTKEPVSGSTSDDKVASTAGETDSGFSPGDHSHDVTIPPFSGNTTSNPALSFTGTSTSTGGVAGLAQSYENRPQYLNVFYIIRIK